MYYLNSKTSDYWKSNVFKNGNLKAKKSRRNDGFSGYKFYYFLKLFIYIIFKILYNNS